MGTPTSGMLLLYQADNGFFLGSFAQSYVILFVKYFGHHTPILISHFMGQLFYSYLPPNHLMGII
jgi:hypothetical protein